MRHLLLTILFSTIQLAQSTIPQWSSLWDDTLPETFNWTTIKPCTKLRYQQCYDDLECARLIVPLDWTGSNRKPWQQVVLAVTRLPAKVKQSDPRFGGTIVLNPGGPSGSGVDLVRWSGRGIQEIVDGEKHFEILSFDPRGTKYSTPSAACFASDTDRLSWALQTVNAGDFDDGRFSLDTKWALSQGFGQLCAQTPLGRFPDNTNIRQYVTTAQVARDMVSLVDSIDEELKHSIRSMSSTSGKQQVISSSSQIPVLNYWGYSYGTYLGNTFASMFPDRIGHMILDGVVDAPDYTATGWTTNLQDNNHLWDLFFDWCLEAGSSCALNDDTIENGIDLSQKVSSFNSYLRDNPIPIIYNDQIILLTYSNLRTSMHFASYGPWQVWPLLATALQQLIHGQPEAFTALHQKFFPLKRPLFSPLDGYNFLDPFNNRSSPYPPGYPHGLEASTAILCGDGDDITNDTKDDFRAYASLLSNQSALIGPHWAQITLWCRHWPHSQRPADRNRFTGPFSSKLKDYQKDPDRTSPLLFIGNTADPVTPVGNAVRMAQEHEGARVLVQNAPGHCSGVTIPSKCTWRVISEFFNYGTLPENGTVCEVDWKPWDRVRE